jgi:hypothetical protein
MQLLAFNGILSIFGPRCGCFGINQLPATTAVPILPLPTDTLSRANGATQEPCRRIAMTRWYQAVRTCYGCRSIALGGSLGSNSHGLRKKRSLPLPILGGSQSWSRKDEKNTAFGSHRPIKRFCAMKVSNKCFAWNSIFAMQYVKFCIVGGSGLVVDMVVLYLAGSSECLGLDQTLSKVIAAEVAMVNNFLWNDTWTFRVSEVSKHGSPTCQGTDASRASLPIENAANRGEVYSTDPLGVGWTDTGRRLLAPLSPSEGRSSAAVKRENHGPGLLPGNQLCASRISEPGATDVHRAGGHQKEACGSEVAPGSIRPSSGADGSKLSSKFESRAAARLMELATPARSGRRV